MPFELGLAVSENSNLPSHSWHVLDSESHLVNNSFNDLTGTDVHIHRGSDRGVLAALGDIFVHEERQPSTRKMYAIYGVLSRNLLHLMMEADATVIYTARVFRNLGQAARNAALPTQSQPLQEGW